MENDVALFLFEVCPLAGLLIDISCCLNFTCQTRTKPNSLNSEVGKTAKKICYKNTVDVNACIKISVLLQML
jgi:hypothetical protein